MEKISKCIGFYVYRRSYLLWSPVTTVVVTQIRSRTQWAPTPPPDDSAAVSAVHILVARRPQRQDRSPLSSLLDSRSLIYSTSTWCLSRCTWCLRRVHTTKARRKLIGAVLFCGTQKDEEEEKEEKHLVVRSPRQLSLSIFLSPPPK